MLRQTRWGRNYEIQGNEFDLPCFGIRPSRCPRQLLRSGSQYGFLLILIERASAAPDKKTCRNTAIPPE
jgi:hypothetical protein